MMSGLEQTHTDGSRPSSITLTTRGEKTAAAALHLLHRPGRAEAQDHLDDLEVVETQQTEKAPENVHYRAAWHDAPKF